MQQFLRSTAALILAAVATGCGSDPGNDPGGTDLSSCTTANTAAITLAVGQYQIIDPVHQSNCLSLPASASAQEYALVAYSGNGNSSNSGSAAAYALQSLIVTAPASSIGGQGIGAGLRAPTLRNPEQFERNLRAAERQLAMTARRSATLATPLGAPPIVGDKDSFYVCSTISCANFNRIGATVKYSGAPGVIYVDDHANAGAEQLTDADLLQLGQLFDNYLYAADTTAFGRESDINHDSRIAILMTPAVNSLTADCTNGRVVGYTFGSDLIPLARGSNAREMFYALTTAVATPTCKAVSRSAALNALPTTLIHELQHMISFNQHTLLRGNFDQDTWLNEGLSHFAEELGWRVVPGAQCGGDCFSRFMGGNIGNAYDYLDNPEGEFLVAPEAGDGTLPERGAAWLFVRWMADHYSTDSTLGTQFTRGMEETSVLGADRIAQLGGADFATLVGRWQLTNWTSNLPGFPTAGLLQYRTFNFRSIFAANFGTIFPKLFPLTPDATTGAYSHAGTLLGGSGRTVRYTLPAGSSGVTIRMAGTKANGALSAAIVPSIAIVRIQ